MTVLVTPDRRIRRRAGEWFTTPVALITLTCCGGQITTSDRTARPLAERLERHHRCASVGV